MNKPVAKGNKTFSSNITYYTDDELNDKKPSLIYFQWFDMATGHGKDKTASIIIGRDQEQYGNVYVMEYFNERIEVDDAIEKIMDQAKKWGPIKSGSQKDLIASTNEKTIRAKALERGINFNFILSTEYQKGVSFGTSKRSKLSKEARMNSLVPWMKAGKIRLAKHMTALADQVIAYPHVVNDDLIETLRDAVVHSFPSDKDDVKLSELDEANRKLKEFLDNWRDKVQAKSNSSQAGGNMFGKWEQEQRLSEQKTISVL